MLEMIVPDLGSDEKVSSIVGFYRISDHLLAMTSCVSLRGIDVGQIIEIIGRVAKISSLIKLVVQGIVMLGFGIAYITLITPHWLTSIVMFALAFVLFYQARRIKIDPTKLKY